MKAGEKQESNRLQVLKLVQKLGVLRSRDLDKIGAARSYLSRPRDDGLLEQLGRDLYALANDEPTVYQTIVLVCKKVTYGVACLQSVLPFHSLTTQVPRELCLANCGSR